MKLKVVPTPTRLRSVILPPISVSSLRQIDSPSPVPPKRRVID